MNNDLRVFGIGLSKSATSSLYKAMNMLGYNSVHLPNPKQLENIHSYHFVNDVPIGRRFKQLDEQFPDAKFILTTRPVDDWIRSIEAHFGRLHHSQIRPYIRKYRFETYGTLVFKEEQLREVYHKHEEEVRDYFKDRPDELLVMDITKGDGWEKLIPFIEHPVYPRHDFPHANKTLERRFKRSAP